MAGKVEDKIVCGGGPLFTEGSIRGSIYFLERPPAQNEDSSAEYRERVD